MDRFSSHDEAEDFTAAGCDEGSDLISSSGEQVRFHKEKVNIHEQSAGKGYHQI